MYLEIAKDILLEHSTFKSILKVDCHNEAHGRPKGGIVPNLLEIFKERSLQYRICDVDKDRLKRARTKYPDLQFDEFDFRLIDRFPYCDKFFDTIFDFSTLDHLSMERAFWVLEEYWRMLKTTGVLVLIVWVATNKESIVTDCNIDEWNPDFQFFFPKLELEKFLSKIYSFKEVGTVLSREIWDGKEENNLPRELVYYLCEVKK